MKNYYLFSGLLFCLCVNAQIVNIPDANFKSQLLAANINNTIAADANGLSMTIDVNNNNQIEVSEALEVYNLYANNSNISSLSGIEAFSNLEVLECFNNQLTNLNLSSLTNLILLDCNSNQLSNLNLTGLALLEYMTCQDNALQNLNLSGLNNLKGLECGGNQLTSLNLAGLNLEALVCEVNQIQSLDLSQQTNLNILQCDSNQLSTLNLAGLNQINYLICNSNLFTTLDVSNLSLLDTFVFNSNPNLTSVNLKNGSIESFVEFDVNPSLVGLCADAGQIIQIQDLVTQYNFTNCTVSSDCSLKTNTFVTADSILIHPNPVNSVLNFELSNDASIYSVAVFNNVGQVVLKSSNSKGTLDVSSLKTGNYWIRINSDKGISNTRFIKL